MVMADKVKARCAECNYEIEVDPEVGNAQLSCVHCGGPLELAGEHPCCGFKTLVGDAIDPDECMVTEKIADSFLSFMTGVFNGGLLKIIYVSCKILGTIAVKLAVLTGLIIAVVLLWESGDWRRFLGYLFIFMLVPPGLYSALRFFRYANSLVADTRNKIADFAFIDSVCILAFWGGFLFLLFSIFAAFMSHDFSGIPQVLVVFAFLEYSAIVLLNPEFLNVEKDQSASIEETFIGNIMMLAKAALCTMPLIMFTGALGVLIHFIGSAIMELRGMTTSINTNLVSGGVLLLAVTILPMVMVLAFMALRLLAGLAQAVLSDKKGGENQSE